MINVPLETRSPYQKVGNVGQTGERCFMTFPSKIRSLHQQVGNVGNVWSLFPPQYMCADVRVYVLENPGKRSPRSPRSPDVDQDCNFAGEHAGERHDQRSPLMGAPPWLDGVP